MAVCSWLSRWRSLCSAALQSFTSFVFCIACERYAVSARTSRYRQTLVLLQHAKNLPTFPRCGKKKKKKKSPGVQTVPWFLLLRAILQASRCLQHPDWCFFNNRSMSTRSRLQVSETFPPRCLSLCCLRLLGLLLLCCSTLNYACKPRCACGSFLFYTSGGLKVFVAKSSLTFLPVRTWRPAALATKVRGHINDERLQVQNKAGQKLFVFLMKCAKNSGFFPQNYAHRSITFPRNLIHTEAILFPSEGEFASGMICTEQFEWDETKKRLTLKSGTWSSVISK